MNEPFPSETSKRKELEHSSGCAFAFLSVVCVATEALRFCSLSLIRKYRQVPTTPYKYTAIPGTYSFSTCTSIAINRFAIVADTFTVSIVGTYSRGADCFPKLPTIPTPEVPTLPPFSVPTIPTIPPLPIPPPFPTRTFSTPTIPS